MCGAGGKGRESFHKLGRCVHYGEACVCIILWIIDLVYYKIDKPCEISVSSLGILWNLFKNREESLSPVDLVPSWGWLKGYIQLGLSLHLVSPAERSLCGKTPNLQWKPIRREVSRESHRSSEDLWLRTRYKIQLSPSQLPQSLSHHDIC